MMDLMGLYRLAEDNDIAVDCFELKKREALSVMDNDGACYIAIDPFKLASEQELDEAISDGHTEMWDLADYFHVTEDFMRKAVCWYTYGNLATELYF